MCTCQIIWWGWDAQSRLEIERNFHALCQGLFHLFLKNVNMINQEVIIIYLYSTLLTKHLIQSVHTWKTKTEEGNKRKGRKEIKINRNNKQIAEFFFEVDYFICIEDQLFILKISVFYLIFFLFYFTISVSYKLFGKHINTATSEKLNH